MRCCVAVLLTLAIIAAIPLFVKRLTVIFYGFTDNCILAQIRALFSVRFDGVGAWPRRVSCAVASFPAFHIIGNFLFFDQG